MSYTAYLLTSNWFNTMHTKELGNKRVLISTNMLVVTGKHPKEYLNMVIQ